MWELTSTSWSQQVCQASKRAKGLWKVMLRTHAP